MNQLLHLAVALGLLRLLCTLLNWRLENSSPPADVDLRSGPSRCGRPAGPVGSIGSQVHDWSGKCAWDTWSVKEVTTTLWPMSWKRARSCPSDAQRPIHRLLFRSINQVPANRRPASRLLLVRCLWPNVLPSIPCRISTTRPSPTTTPATSDGQAWPKLTNFIGEIEIQPVKLCSPLTCFFLAFQGRSKLFASSGWCQVGGQAYSSGRNSQLGSRPVSISPHGFQRVYQYGPAFGRRNSIFFFILKRKKIFHTFYIPPFFFYRYQHPGSALSWAGIVWRQTTLSTTTKFTTTTTNFYYRRPMQTPIELAIITTLPVLVRQVIAKTPTAVAKVFINEWILYLSCTFIIYQTISRYQRVRRRDSPMRTCYTGCHNRLRQYYRIVQM